MSNSKKSSKYDKKVVKKYKKFVGVKELKKLLNNFDSEKFAGEWKQVMCSRSTALLGSSADYSSVQATYTLKKNDIIGVKNDAYDDHLNRVSITGTSEARVTSVPTCRIVKFNNLFNVKGDYWLIYATPSFKTIIVAAPLIVNFLNSPIVLTNNLGVYVLSRNTRQFWSSPKEYEPTFDALEKYGFTKFWNKPIPTAESFEL